MNLNNVEIDVNCENRLKPIYHFKKFIEEQKGNYIKKVRKIFFDKITIKVDETYRNSASFLLNEIIEDDDVIDSEIVIPKFLKYSEQNEINKLANKSLIIKQSIKKFLVMKDNDRKEIFDNIVNVIENENWNYYELLQEKMNEFCNLDDDIYNTILNDDYVYLRFMNKQIYLYKSGLSIILLENNRYSIIRKEKVDIEFLIKYVELSKLKNKIVNGEELKDSRNLCKVINGDTYWMDSISFGDVIIELLRNYQTIKSENLIQIAMAENIKIDLNCRKDAICVSEEIDDSNSKYYLNIAKFFATPKFLDRDLAIKYAKKSIENNITEAYLLITDLYINNKDFKNARDILQEALNVGTKGSLEKLNKLNSIENRLKGFKYRKSFIEEKFSFILENFRQKTKRECNIFELKEDVTAIKNSKIYGEPYLPIGEEYPVGKDGKPLALLIQINFEEFELENYPSKGILEVFVDRNISYDLDYEIRYYEDSNLKYQTVFPQIDTEKFIVNRTYKIVKIEKKETFLPVSNYRFNAILKSLVNEACENAETINEVKAFLKKNSSQYSGGIKTYLENEFLDIIADDYYPDPLMVGGYADFTQEDIRYGKLKDYTECLIKLDSRYNFQKDGEMKYPLYLGDSGILNVLLSKRDLLERNFKNAIVTWDCC